MYEDEDYSDSDSISDSFEDIDASGASEGVLGGCIPPPEVYKKRSDFASNDDYAIYVRDHAQVLLLDHNEFWKPIHTVTCLRLFEIGDVCLVLDVP